MHIVHAQADVTVYGLHSNDDARPYIKCDVGFNSNGNLSFLNMCNFARIDFK